MGCLFLVWFHGGVEGSGKWLGWRPLQQCCPHQNCSPAETAREELGSASFLSSVV